MNKKSTWGLAEGWCSLRSWGKSPPTHRTEVTGRPELHSILQSPATPRTLQAGTLQCGRTHPLLRGPPLCTHPQLPKLGSGGCYSALATKNTVCWDQKPRRAAGPPFAIHMGSQWGEIWGVGPTGEGKGSLSPTPRRRALPKVFSRRAVASPDSPKPRGNGLLLHQPLEHTQLI